MAVFFAAWWIVMILLLPLPIALFPDGRLPPRWRWTLPAYVVLCAVLLAVFAWHDVTGVLARRIQTMRKHIIHAPPPA